MSVILNLMLFCRFLVYLIAFINYYVIISKSGILSIGLYLSGLRVHSPIKFLFIKFRQQFIIGFRISRKNSKKYRAEAKILYYLSLINGKAS